MSVFRGWEEALGVSLGRLAMHRGFSLCAKGALPQRFPSGDFGLLRGGALSGQPPFVAKAQPAEGLTRWPFLQIQRFPPRCAFELAPALCDSSRSVRGAFALSTVDVRCVHWTSGWTLFKRKKGGSEGPAETETTPQESLLQPPSRPSSCPPAHRERKEEEPSPGGSSSQASSLWKRLVEPRQTDRGAQGSLRFPSFQWLRSFPKNKNAASALHVQSPPLPDQGASSGAAGEAPVVSSSERETHLSLLKGMATAGEGSSGVAESPPERAGFSFGSFEEEVLRRLLAQWKEVGRRPTCMREALQRPLFVLAAIAAVAAVLLTLHWEKVRRRVGLEGAEVLKEGMKSQQLQFTG